MEAQKGSGSTAFNEADFLFVAFGIQGIQFVPVSAGLGAMTNRSATKTVVHGIAINPKTAILT